MIYFRDLSQGAADPPTFAEDENRPALPLPRLSDTMDRYYQSLVPFGTKEELARSRQIIERFRAGVGPKLQEILEQRAKVEKNWVSPKIN